MKNKCHICVLSLAVLLSFSGCSEESIRANVESEALDYFDDDADYLEYKELESKGLVDTEGKYLEAEEYLNEAEQAIPAMAEVREGTIHISFASNSFLNINYYRDESHDILVEGDCYLNPGDSLYYTEPVLQNTNSGNYRMKYIRAIEYSSNGERLNEAFNNSEKIKYNLIQIPEDFKGTELSIEPVGEYAISTLTFEDVYLTSESEKHPANGKWIINNVDRKTDSFGKLEYTPTDPLEETSIQYEYDINEYYFVYSKPEALYVDENTSINGHYTIPFPNHLPDDENTEYSVLLSRYINITFSGKNDKIISVKKNGESVFEKKFGIKAAINVFGWEDNKAKGVDKLKLDDRIEITVQEGFELEKVDGVENWRDDGQIYSFSIPLEKREDFVVNVVKSKNN